MALTNPQIFCQLFFYFYSYKHKLTTIQIANEWSNDYATAASMLQLLVYINFIGHQLDLLIKFRTIEAISVGSKCHLSPYFYNLHFLKTHIEVWKSMLVVFKCWVPYQPLPA